jgi:diguanylate cyclase (GGDEF)-like protein
MDERFSPIPHGVRRRAAHTVWRELTRVWSAMPLARHLLQRICVALLLAAIAVSAGAQGSGRYADTIFEHIDQKSGLPSPIVQAVALDGSGFVWVGTGSGISRWDGYHFRNYAMQVGAAGSLPDNNIYALYADPLGRLWIGTKSRGLALYNPALDNFQTFVPPGKEKAYPTIYSIMTDGAKGLWLGTSKGIDHLDPDTGTFTPVDLEGIKVRNSILSLVRDREGRIWAGTTKGLFRSDRDGKHFAAQAIFGSIAAKVWRLRFDRDGRLWIGTTQGAFVLEPSETQARPIHETTPGPSLLDQQAVDTIAEAAPGVIWLGTFGQGIVAVDAKTLQTHRIVHDPAFSNSLLDNMVVTLVTDPAGSVWVGTASGLGRADAVGNGIQTFYGATGVAGQDDRIVDSNVTAVLPTPDGHLWLGFNEKGVEIVAREGTRNGMRLDPIRQIATGPKGPLPVGQINALVSAPDGSVYIGTFDWVYRADSEGNRPVRLPFGPQETAQVDSLLYDAGTLWIGSRGGLWTEDVSGGASRKLPPPILMPLTNQQIVALARGTGNDIWIGTSVELFRYDTVTHDVERIPVDPADLNALPAAVTSIVFDRRHRLWATTWGGGVCVLEGRDANGKPKIRRLLQGLPNSNADSVLEAPDGNMWVTTDGGLAIIDPVTFNITPLRQPDGVAIGAYWVKSGGKTLDGSLLFGGTGGLTVVQPNLVTPWNYVAPVVVTDVLLGDKPSPPAGLNIPDGNARIEIHHDANSLVVEFAALDYTAPDLNLYEYKLNGFDHDWVTTSVARRIASYTNLSPGNYTLELRGSNRDGVWGKTRVVRIRVVPAWYQTLWAKIAALLAILLLLAGAFLSSTAYLRARQRELERRVELRTAELKKITEELQESRLQLEAIAHSDTLTGIPNRRMFNDHFRRLLASSCRHNKSFVLLLLDLDKFKEINDSYGHDVGDAWLRTVALRVNSMLRQSECFARLGGDEFAILLTDPIDEDNLAKICRALADSVEEPLLVDGIRLSTTLSIGVAIYPQDGAEEKTLLKSADIALYCVKREGGNGWHRYEAEPREDAVPKPV